MFSRLYDRFSSPQEKISIHQHIKFWTVGLSHTYPVHVNKCSLCQIQYSISSFPPDLGHIICNNQKDIIYTPKNSFIYIPNLSISGLQNVQSNMFLLCFCVILTFFSVKSNQGDKTSFDTIEITNNST